MDDAEGRHKKWAKKIIKKCHGKSTPSLRVCVYGCVFISNLPIHQLRALGHITTIPPAIPPTQCRRDERVESSTLSRVCSFVGFFPFFFFSA